MKTAICQSKYRILNFSRYLISPCSSPLLTFICNYIYNIEGKITEC